MKVKTLIILSIVFFAIGSLGGAAYAYVSGGSVIGTVAGILPAAKTPEEKLIDDFIKEQETKQQNDTQQPAGAKDDTPTSKPSAPQPAENDAKEPSKTDQPQDTSGSQKRMGQPTVSDNATLNVRKTPKDGEVLIGIPNTEKVEIIDEKNGWYQIITANGTKGWVSAQYLKEL